MTTRTLYTRSPGCALSRDWLQYVEHAHPGESESAFVARLDAQYPPGLSLTIETLHEYTGRLVAHVRVFDSCTKGDSVVQ